MLTQSFIFALNHLLTDADWARDKLMPFAGKQARIDLPPLSVRFTVQSDGMLAAASDDSGGEAEVRITLPAAAPLLALGGMDKLMREARIAGAAEFAEALGFVLRNLRWDYAEDLSKLVGDIAAQRIEDATNSLLNWQKQAALNLAENAAEYLREEQPMLPQPGEVSAFISAVDALRDDVARLEKRLQRLS